MEKSEVFFFWLTDFHLYFVSFVKQWWICKNANCLPLEYFIKNYDFVYGHVCTYVCMHIEVRGQVCSIDFLFVGSRN